MSISSIIPSNDWCLFMPIRSICENIKKYMCVIDWSKEENIQEIKQLLFYASQQLDEDLKEFFSQIYYQSPTSTEVLYSKNIFLDERFESVYQLYVNMHKLEPTKELINMNLLLQYEKQNGLDYFHKIEHGNPYFSDNLFNKIDKYDLLFEYCIENKNAKNRNHLINIENNRLVPVYENWDKIYHQNDVIREILFSVAYRENNDLRIHTISFSIENYQKWKNKEISIHLTDECIKTAKIITKSIKSDMEKINSPIHNNIFAEYFSHLQNFINKQCLLCSENNNLYIVNMFLNAFGEIKFPVVLEGKLRDIYIKYHHLIENKINTLENIDELNKFYEKHFINETSAYLAPTSVIQYLQDKGKVSKTGTLSDAEKYVAGERTKKVVQFDECKLSEIAVCKFKKLYYFEQFSKFGVSLSIKDEDIIDIIKMRMSLKSIIDVERFQDKINELLKSGKITKEDYEFYFSEILTNQKQRKIMKVI